MPTLRVTAALATLLAFVSPPVALHATPQGGNPTTRTTVVLADSTSVPIDVPDGRAIVLVSLDGRGPYRLAVETGSPDVLVSPKVVADLRLHGIGRGEGDSLFRLDSLRIGKALIRSLPVGRDDAFAMLGVDGVLGLEAYRDLLLTIDYPNKRLSLSRERLPAADGRDVLRAVRVGPFIGIPVELGEVWETGVIDTQGGVGLQVIEDVAGQLTFQGPLKMVGRARVGGGEPVEVKMGILTGDARLGRHVLHQPRIAVHPLPPDIPSRVTIGIEVLRNFTIAIDQRSMLVKLTPSP